MTHVGSINTEGGPLICGDYKVLRLWKGSDEGAPDYQMVCARFDAIPDLPATLVESESGCALAWEMCGAGVADVFKHGDGIIRVIRAWLDEDSTEKVNSLASINGSLSTTIGQIEVPSRFLGLLWAPESGKQIPLKPHQDLQVLSGTSLDSSGLLLKVSSSRYRCDHDEVTIGCAKARRLTFIPLGTSSH